MALVMSTPINNADRVSAIRIAIDAEMRELAQAEGQLVQEKIRAKHATIERLREMAQGAHAD